MIEVNFKKTSTDGNRKLLILLKNKSGDFILAGLGNKILWCVECYGALGGPEGGVPEIKVKNKIITIYQSGGNVDAVDVTLKFKCDGQANKFRLIGKDTIVRNRPSGNVETISINYLTNTKKIGNINFDRFGDNEKITDHLEKIKLTKIYLETYNIEDL